MKAVVYQRFGSEEVLQIKEVPRPVKKPNQIVIKLKATSVNSGDIKLRNKNVPWFFKIPIGFFAGWKSPKFPILGNTFSGIVYEIGSQVQQFKPGDQVFGSLGTNLGTYAEYISIPETSPVLKKPKTLTFQEAAAIPFGGQTALYFLKKANLQAGKKVLIYGASGSVGTAAIQIAKAMGADVYGASTHKQLIEELGGKFINYKTEDYQTKGPYDVIFQSVGYSNFNNNINCLTPNGVMILISVNQLSWYFKTLWKSLTSRQKIIASIVDETKQNLAQLIDLYQKGSFKPLIDRKYRLQEIREAHKYVQQGHKISNVVITI